MRLDWRSLFGRHDLTEQTIIFGIGNPGSKYLKTRHNAGLWCIDKLATAHSIVIAKNTRLSILGEGLIRESPVVLVKPKTFVNDSGRAITSLLSRYRTNASRFIVVHDEMALPPGTLRIRPDGSHAGHNGVKSIIGALGSQEFTRIKIGVGRPQGQASDIDHVLGVPSQEEHASISTTVRAATEAIETILTEGIETAMNKFN